MDGNATARLAPAAARPAATITCTVTLLAHPSREGRPTLGRLRALATRKTRVVVMTTPRQEVEPPRQVEVTRWNQLC